MANDRRDKPVSEFTSYESYATFDVSRPWEPAVNVYERSDRLEVCAEIAGMRKADIHVHVEPGRLTIRGRRSLPEACPSTPPSDTSRPQRIVCLEIESGAFQRMVSLPERIDIGKVRSQYRDGMLWVTLPYRQKK